MKIKPLSKIHRAVIGKRNDWGTDLIRLTIQVKSTVCFIIPVWRTTCWIDIEIDNYWGYMPGHPIHGGCLTLSYQFGGEREVWPPDIFDLEDRIHQLYETYLAVHRNATNYKSVIDTQIKNLA